MLGAREFRSWALRRRRLWRVSGTSMEPQYHEGDYVILESVPAAMLAVGDVVVTRHPFKNLDVIKTIDEIDDAYLELRSPQGQDSRQFGRVPIGTVRGRVSVNLNRLVR